MEQLDIEVAQAIPVYTIDEGGTQSNFSVMQMIFILVLIFLLLLRL